MGNTGIGTHNNRNLVDATVLTPQLVTIEDKET